MLNKLEMLKIFCAAAEASNFKEAAIRLGISPQSVSRAISTLEEQLGEMLFFRNTRHNQITPFGLALAQRARQSLHQVEDIFSPADKSEQVMKGLVRIAASNALAHSCLPALISELLAQQPQLQIELQFSDDHSDVVAEQIDIGIRIGLMRDSQLVAKVVSQCTFYTVATPALVARHGLPASLEALASLPTIVVLDPKTGRPWPWFLNDGATWHPKQPVIATNDAVYEYQAMLSGAGFGQLAGFLAIPHLRDGTLLHVLPDITPPAWNVYIYRAHKTPVPARIRLVFDWLAKGFADRQRFPVTL